MVSHVTLDLGQPGQRFVTSAWETHGGRPATYAECYSPSWTFEDPDEFLFGQLLTGSM